MALSDDVVENNFVSWLFYFSRYTATVNSTNTVAADASTLVEAEEEEEEASIRLIVVFYLAY